MTEGAEKSVQDILPWRTETGLASASVPSGHIAAFGIRVALMSRRFIAGALAFIHVRFAKFAFETTATRALVRSDASSTILTRSITHSYKKMTTNFHQNCPDFISFLRVQITFAFDSISSVTRTAGALVGSGCIDAGGQRRMAVVVQFVSAFVVLDALRAVVVHFGN